MTSIHCVQLRVGFAFQYDKTKTSSYLNGSQFSFYYINKGINDMLFPKLSVISTQYTKTVDGVKGALPIPLLFISEQLVSFALPRVAGINQLKLFFCATLCHCFCIYLNYPLQCRQFCVCSNFSWPEISIEKVPNIGTVYFLES